MFIITGCGTDSNTGMGTMEVRLHDMPIDSADAVNVFVERVEINSVDDTTGWQTISSPEQSYNLLELTNGAYAVLGDTALPAGTYPQIRLILSQDGHSVEIDGDTYDMMVPSGAQTGVKINVNAEIEDGVNYVLMLDFDASRSVVEAGNNPVTPYLLQPVISGSNEAVTGGISGTASTAEAEPLVYAIAGQDTVSTTVADTSSGFFNLIGLEEGSYTVSVEPRNDNFARWDTTDIDVTVEETTELGTIELSQN